MKGGRRRPPNVSSRMRAMSSACFNEGRPAPAAEWGPIRDSCTPATGFNEGRPAPAAEYVQHLREVDNSSASMKGGRRRPPNLDYQWACNGANPASMKGGRRRPPNR